MTSTTAVECLIVGGGPAGLTAATYLGRFRRSATLVDSGSSRLKQIPISRNIPGFPDGIIGGDLHARMRQQAGKFGARLLEGEITRLACDDKGFIASGTCGEFRANTVLLATGVNVAAPAIDDLDHAVQKGLIRYCPICDGFEARGRRVAVLGGRPHSLDEAHFLRTYVEDLTFVAEAGGEPPSASDIARARRAGIKVEETACTGLRTTGEKIEVALSVGPPRQFDIVYPCLGVAPRSELARSLGARVSEKGELLTDKHQQTNVPGLFAAGDVLRGLDQVASACGQAAIAATAMHNMLREQDAGGEGPGP